MQAAQAVDRACDITAELIAVSNTCVARSDAALRPETPVAFKWKVQEAVHHLIWCARCQNRMRRLQRNDERHAQFVIASLQKVSRDLNARAKSNNSEISLVPRVDQQAGL